MATLSLAMNASLFSGRSRDFGSFRCSTSFWRRSVACSALTAGGSSTNKDMAVLLEIDGPVVDLHRNGHRQSFNVAFQKLGLDCANWSEPVYLDLFRQTCGKEENMLRVFFDRIGWPVSLPTGEKEAFVQKLIKSKEKELETLASSNIVPLRPGLTEFLDEAIEERVAIIFLAAYTKSGDRLSRLLLDKLGPERTESISVIGPEEVENSAYGQVVLGGGVTSSLDELLAAEVAKSVASEKQRLAKEIASALKLSVEIDTTSSMQVKKAGAALRAGAEAAGLPVDRCVLLAAGQLGTEAANQIKMPCIVVRSSLTARAEFPLAKACLEGFGVGAITIPRLRKYL